MCNKKGSGLNAAAASFTPKPVAPLATGVFYDGTDPGALNPEYFYVEAPTNNFRRILPHGHITCTMQNAIANISYTFRNGTKIGSVVTDEHWQSIKADSPPIYNMLSQYR